jgi:hypothetical protein
MWGPQFLCISSLNSPENCFSPTEPGTSRAAVQKWREWIKDSEGKQASLHNVMNTFNFMIVSLLPQP